MGLGLPESPVHEETDCQAPEQTGDQQPIIGSDTAPVVVERHIQPLVASILDPQPPVILRLRELFSKARITLLCPKKLSGL